MSLYVLLLSDIWNEIKTLFSVLVSTANSKMRMIRLTILFGYMLLVAGQILFIFLMESPLPMNLRVVHFFLFILEMFCFMILPFILFELLFPHLWIRTGVEEFHQQFSTINSESSSYILKKLLYRRIFASFLFSWIFLSFIGVLLAIDLIIFRTYGFSLPLSLASFPFWVTLIPIILIFPAITIAFLGNIFSVHHGSFLKRSISASEIQRKLQIHSNSTFYWKVKAFERQSWVSPLIVFVYYLPIIISTFPDFIIFLALLSGENATFDVLVGLFLFFFFYGIIEDVISITMALKLQKKVFRLENLNHQYRVLCDLTHLLEGNREEKEDLDTILSEDAIPTLNLSFCCEDRIFRRNNYYYLYSTNPFSPIAVLKIQKKIKFDGVQWILSLYSDDQSKRPMTQIKGKISFFLTQTFQFYNDFSSRPTCVLKKTRFPFNKWLIEDNTKLIPFNTVIIKQRRHRWLKFIIPLEELYSFVKVILTGEGKIWTCYDENKQEIATIVEHVTLFRVFSIHFNPDFFRQKDVNTRRFVMNLITTIALRQNLI